MLTLVQLACNLASSRCLIISIAITSAVIQTTNCNNDLHINLVVDLFIQIYNLCIISLESCQSAGLILCMEMVINFYFYYYLRSVLFGTELVASILISFSGPVPANIHKSAALTSIFTCLCSQESTGQEEGLLVGKVRMGGNGGGENRREHMFDKVLTPSDIGKLNRLVVPKVFAERYFPAAARGSVSGTVLCFQDARGGGGGEVWRFRYSYWSSSQSYVMTKGWSRFVRDKRLAAGDTVSFFRGAGGRLFVDCWRRGAAPAIAPTLTQQAFVGKRTPTEARGRCLRLFGVDLETGAEPLLLDLQLASRR